MAAVVLHERLRLYYVIACSRGSPVVAEVLGRLFNGTFVCDFFGAYNLIEAATKQCCLVHMFGELEKMLENNTCADMCVCILDFLYPHSGETGTSFSRNAFQKVCTTAVMFYIARWMSRQDFPAAFSTAYGQHMLVITDLSYGDAGV